MNSPIYFFDSYAIAKFLVGDPAYAKYENAHGILTIFNLAELNWAFKRDNKMMADQLVKQYASIQVPVEPEDIPIAMDLRLQNRALSIPDVIGYTVAGRYGIPFLTGDKGFEYLENVEFVK
ncbi:MAG: PIN domain-containing protein [Candidatus Diapherotrites archaeon]|nr:PIN domain-containing protein [Candidatus Diapherotrites archaeon]MDZ4256376.1 PIN domain-containing protein [archaeon]